MAADLHTVYVTGSGSKFNLRIDDKPIKGLMSITVDYEVSTLPKITFEMFVDKIYYDEETKQELNKIAPEPYSTTKRLFNGEL